MQHIRSVLAGALLVGVLTAGVACSDDSPDTSDAATGTTTATSTTTASATTTATDTATATATPSETATASATATPTVTATGTATGTDGGATQQVTIAEFALPSITIARGTEVVWTNQDSAPHTATADDGSFDSGQLTGDATYSHTFDEAGTFAYHCDVHPSMTGTITVN